MLTLPKDKLRKAKREHQNIEKGNGVSFKDAEFKSIAPQYPADKRLIEKSHDVVFFDKYFIRNVPYGVIEGDDQESYDAQVALTVTVLRDLMLEEKIPREVDFQDFAEVGF